MMLQRVTFSTVASEDLKKAGVKRGLLAFEPAKVAELADGLTTDAGAEIADLHSRIKKIYAHVNMDVRHVNRLCIRSPNLLVVRTRFPHDS